MKLLLSVPGRLGAYLLLLVVKSYGLSVMGVGLGMRARFVIGGTMVMLVPFFGRMVRPLNLVAVRG